MNTETRTYLIGYRGTKVHAVDPTFRSKVSLCGWGVEVSEMAFAEMPGLTCKICAKAVRNA